MNQILSIASAGCALGFGLYWGVLVASLCKDGIDALAKYCGTWLARKCVKKG